MTKRKTSARAKKLNRNAKIGIAALTTTALIGGWNAIGHLEATTSQVLAAEAAVAVELVAPTATLFIPPAPILLPTIPALEIAPIATLAPMGDGLLLDTTGANAAIAPAPSLNIQPLAALAPLPTMAPLPDLPSMPAPPPPSNNRSSGGGGGSDGGGGGGKSSGGS